MKKIKSTLNNKKKGEDIMAIMTKPRTIIPVIGVDKSKKFIKESNKRRLTTEDLTSIHNSSRIFKNK